MATDANEPATSVKEASPVMTEIKVAPEVGMGEVVSLAAEGHAPAKVSRARAAELAKAINLKDTQSIISFGIESQKNATQVSEQMLTGVRTKDTGPVGEAMNQMVHTMRGLDFSQIKPGQKPGFFARLLGKASALTLFLQKYETVESQITAAQNNLDKHRQQLLRDIVMLDKLYITTLQMLDGLDETIAAVEYKLEEVNSVDIPAAQEKAKASGDMADTQAANDLINARDDLERRLADLKTTRMVTIQALPSIRIVQTNDKGLSEKIQSQILNALPLWKRNMALAIAAWRSEEAGKATKAATDFTNQLIEQSQAQLQTSNKAIRTELERGIIDVESVKKANEALIQTINDTIEIAAQGKAARAAAEKELIDAESKLKQALLSASQKQVQAH